MKVIFRSGANTQLRLRRVWGEMRFFVWNWLWTVNNCTRLAPDTYKKCVWEAAKVPLKSPYGNHPDLARFTLELCKCVMMSGFFHHLWVLCCICAQLGDLTKLSQWPKWVKPCFPQRTKRLPEKPAETTIFHPSGLHFRPCLFLRAQNPDGHRIIVTL